MIDLIHESKVTAFIIRRRRQRFQMLAFRIRGSKHRFYRLPGGGIHQNEMPNKALYREIAEESALTQDDLIFLRGVGQLMYYKPLTHKAVTMYDFILLFNGSSKRRFSVEVKGNDKDSGYIFDFKWIGTSEIYKVDPELRQLINTYNLPEFFISPLNFGLGKGKVRIRNHSAIWERIYEFEEIEIRNVLGAEALIHHVGSTSVKGLKAKPIIDILIGYPANSLPDQFLAVLTEIGYIGHGEAGVEGRRFFAKGSGTVTYFHISAYPLGHAGYKSNLKIRDTLRENEFMRRKYEKYKAKHKTARREEYTRNKKNVMDEIIAV